MIAEIENWLQGPQIYRIGRVLYNCFGQDQELKALFAQGATDWNKTKLLESLQELNAGIQHKVENDEYAEMPKSDDAVLQALQEEWKPIYQAMNYKRHELDKYQNGDAQSEAILCAIAHDILKLEQQCMAIWSKRNYYQEHGQLPDVPEAAAPVLTDPLDIGLRMETLKRNIRRNKAKATKFPDKANYPQLVKQYESELEALTNGK